MVCLGQVEFPCLTHRQLTNEIVICSCALAHRWGLILECLQSAPPAKTPVGGRGNILPGMIEVVVVFVGPTVG